MTDRRWLLLSVLAPPRGEELLLVDALRRLGARSVEREGERFVARLPPPPELDALLAQAAAAVAASTSIPDPGLDWRWEDRAAWAERWSRELAPRRVTDRIVVAPAGVPVEALPDDIVIRLDPGTAFGTAEHPTTRMCLGFLDGLVTAGDRVLDIGTGSGILALAAARLGAARVLALEADPMACDDARANARLAGVTDRVRVRREEVTAESARRLGRFHGVVVNLEWGLLGPLVPALPATLVRGGWLVVAGPLRPERDAVIAAARLAGLTVHAEAVDAGWWAGRFAPGA
jgi:ribosomal protein L11 methyltransferase